LSISFDFQILIGYFVGNDNKAGIRHPSQGGRKYLPLPALCFTCRFQA